MRPPPTSPSKTASPPGTAPPTTAATTPAAPSSGDLGVAAGLAGEDLLARAAQRVALRIATGHPDLAAEGGDGLTSDHGFGQPAFALHDVGEAVVVAVERRVGDLGALDEA